MAIDFTPAIDFEEDKIPESFISPGLKNTAISVGKSVLGAVSPELTSTVEAYQSPEGQKLKDLTAIPMQGLRGLATLPVSGLQRASEATRSDYMPQTTGEKVADIGAQIIEPRSLLASKVLEAAAPLAGPAAKGLGKQASKLQEVLTGLDANNFRTLFDRPMDVLSALSSKITGKAFQATKEAAGVSDAENRALALSEGMRKKMYRTVMDKIDTFMSTPESQGKSLEAQDLRKLWADTATEQTGMDPIKGAAYRLPESFAPESTAKPLPADISVADLLKAKKAGNLIAEADPSAAGLIQHEIHNKINPLLQRMAPDVYAAQQAVHLSKVKESLVNLFPQGKGMMNYFRTISMLGGSMFHGIGALESPIIQAGLTLGTKGITEAASSTPGKIAAGAGLNRLINNSALQSLKDRLKNANP